MKKPFSLHLLLLLTGLAWGLTTPLTKLAVSTGYQPFGVMFWQLILIVVLSGALTFYQHRRFVFRREALGLYLGVAVLGTLLPDYIVYTSAVHLSAGMLSILLAMVPVFSLPMAVLLGLERPALLRVLGAVCGAVSIVVMIGPEASLPQRSDIGFALFVLGAAALYAGQGIFIAVYGTLKLDAIQILFGASVLGFVFIAPAAVITDQFVTLWRPWAAAEWAILGTAFFHALAYGGYLALVSRAGPVFTSQVAYIVTAAGVLWSMVLLRETYSVWVWAAFVLMFIGIILVQPRRLDRVD